MLHIRLTTQPSGQHATTVDIDHSAGRKELLTFIREAARSRMPLTVVAISEHERTMLIAKEARLKLLKDNYEERLRLDYARSPEKYNWTLTTIRATVDHLLGFYMQDGLMPSQAPMLKETLDGMGIEATGAAMRRWIDEGV